MKHTIAQNKQLFNVKTIANSVSLDNLADGEFGVFPVGSNTSVAAGTTFATLPAEFRLISKLNGEVYYSFDTIKKSEIRNFAAQAYKAPVVNIWEATIEHCDCIKSAIIKIGLEEDTLIRQNGLSWTDTDSTSVGAPSELTCACDCTGQSTYDNHLMTREAYVAINAQNSPFYFAKVQVTGGAVLADLAAIDAHIAANKAANTDGDPSTDTDKLILIIEGKPLTAQNYRDLDLNYSFPRGVRLFPSISLNGGKSCVEFTETQAVEYELNAGADLRAEEFESMNYYTRLNHFTQLQDGIASEDLIYQFENGKQYNTVNFEFYTDKVNKNDGDKRSFGVLLGTDDASVFADLSAMFN